MQSVHYHSSLEPFLDSLPFYTRYISTLPPHFCKETRPFQLLTSILAFRTPKNRPQHPHSATTKHILSFAPCLLSPPFPLNPSYPNLPPRSPHLDFSQSKKKQKTILICTTRPPNSEEFRMPRSHSQAGDVIVRRSSD
jgi:hypothetical protein